MAVLALQLAGLALSVSGCLGAILACALPMWKMTAFIGSNIIVAQVFWEGLWMNCVYESTGQMQCKIYDSLLDLPSDLQAARALVVVSIAMAFLALLVAITGAECTRCIEDRSTKAKVSAVAGTIFILAGLALLVPVSWSASTIISNFYNPLVPEALKRELGLSLYVGWAASALLVFGGAMLCCLFPQNKAMKPYPVRYCVAKRSNPGSYARKDYV
ncbi:claudin-3-like [Eublepharis macularius]|uniref:Claudin n=1 Tax=Eublepharis macularius TaxID=481883 RepID=A0AA97LLQ1_EUBMA|nr:claudin-3-like [Eublepharis macularius]